MIKLSVSVFFIGFFNLKLKSIFLESSLNKFVYQLYIRTNNIIYILYIKWIVLRLRVIWVWRPNEERRFPWQTTIGSCPGKLRCLTRLWTRTHTTELLFSPMSDASTAAYNLYVEQNSNVCGASYVMNITILL